MALKFTAKDFNDFTTERGIMHNKSSPNHQQSNGKAESAVKIIKNLMRKCIKENSNMYLALLEQRNMPRQYSESPDKMMFNRDVRTQIPQKQRNSHEQAQRRIRQETIRRTYNKNARNPPKLKTKQSVTYKDGKDDRYWKFCRIKKVMGDREYLIQGENDGLYRRNRRDIRPSDVKFEPQGYIPDEQEGNEESIIHIDKSENDTGNDKVQNNATLEEEPRRSQRIRRPPEKMKDYIRK